MTDKRTIEQVLAEQHEELVALRNVELCSRKEENATISSSSPISTKKK